KKTRSKQVVSKPQRREIPLQNPTLLVLAALLLVAVFYIGMLTQKVNNLQGSNATPQPAVSPTPARAKVTTGTLPLLGKDSAKVTVIEFADYQCPFCEKWFQDVEPNIISDYVNKGKVKYAFR